MPTKPTPSSPIASPAPAKSRLGRGLNSLIKVSIPPAPNPPVTGSPVQAPPVQAPPTATGTTLPASAGTAGAPLPAGQSSGPSEDPHAIPTASGAVSELPIEAILPNPHQPRRTFTDANLRELADSIRSNGIIQPLVVRKLPNPATASRTGAGAGGGAGRGTGGGTGGGVTAKYELIAGERRLRAAKAAGLTKVPAHIKDVDALTQAQMALVENIQREDLNPIERAQGYKTLLTQLGLTQSELAVRLGEERSTVANFVRLLDLAAPVQTLLREGQLTLGHAKILAGIPDILEQERLGKLAIEQHLSVRNLEKIIADHASGAAKSPAAPSTATTRTARDAHYAELEKTITRSLGLRAQLKGAGSKGKGKLTLHYTNLDQFDSLMSKLGVDLD